MRVCLISREYPPDTGWGGIATFAHHLAHGLVSLGHEVEVVALAKDEAKTVFQDNIRVHRVRPHEMEGDLGAMALCMPYSRYVLRTSAALWKKFHELHASRPFDVVDTPELLAEGLVPAVTKAAPLLIRLYTPHSKFIAEQLHNVTASFDHQFVALLERVAMLAADVITSPSEDLADFVSRDLSIDRDTIHIVRNPIDPVEFSPDGERVDTPAGRLTVLFVGRLEERKGIHYLIEAVPPVAKAVPNVRFLVIGDDTNNAKGQKSVLAELKESIGRKHCQAYVEFIDRVPLSELPKYYRSADVCVVPSVYDNSPYTCLEAMACGKAVVGTSAGGTREYIVHQDSGIIVPPRDSDAIAEALVALLKDDRERVRLGANARARVLEKFQRTEIARQTIELYRQAQESFQRRSRSSFYRKPPAQALCDGEQLAFAYDKMLYDFLYRHSLRFRVNHWATQFVKRPRLSVARIFVAVARKLCIMARVRSERTPDIILQMEEQIRLRQRRTLGECADSQADREPALRS
ncbi:MAG TPA: glycosyltransferase family 4 protein [Candidatus Obscuribacterales bacterium]